MNKVSLVGRVAVDPKVNKTSNGKSYMFLRLAVEGYFDKKTKQMTTDFIPVTVWGREADKCRNLLKGSLISIEGRVSAGSFADSNGEKKFSLDIIAESISFLSKPKSKGA
ncbi:single-strand DNA-binding protein [Thermoactinomyces sp. DSM 45891]|uniref:single-stranded DNA-binding protein n=1 Tax=Thermoactinomyces sp. DSM 45891 TaxID=1761907 RepID=UPI000924431A|nr:single-stranded DNA-binding protein [Thermoactinomyces sp. DSM 45891]SFX65877.1 single-strand DNA-binding protein [Thermoactinomyces sp. DSM 45891]